MGIGLPTRTNVSGWFTDQFGKNWRLGNSRGYGRRRSSIRCCAWAANWYDLAPQHPVRTM